MDKIIIVETREVLLTRDYMADLSASVSALPISRRDVLNWGSETLYEWIGWGGRIVTGEGDELVIYPGIFDDVHGEDGSGSWISVLRRRRTPQRHPRKTLCDRLRLYDSVFKLAGRPVTAHARRHELKEARHLLRSFNPVWRARYINEVRKLRRAYQGDRIVHYSAAVRRLRLRFAAELEAWHQRDEDF